MYTALYLTGTYISFLTFDSFRSIQVLELTCFLNFDRTNTLGAYLITPAMGSHFVMFFAKMKGLLSIISSS